MGSGKGKSRRTQTPTLAPLNAGLKPYVLPNGSKEWKLGDQFHRLDGPAIEYADGGEEWWVYGQRHRADGPAIRHANGYTRWWFNNRCMSEEEVREAQAAEDAMRLVNVKNEAPEKVTF
jgi:hypothetical protein